MAGRIRVDAGRGQAAMSDNILSAKKPKSETDGGWIEYALLLGWEELPVGYEYVTDNATDELTALRAQLAEAREGLTEANEIMSVARHLNTRAYRAWVDKYYEHLVKSA